MLDSELLNNSNINAIINVHIDKIDRFGEGGIRKLLTIGRKDQSGDEMSGVGLSVEQADLIVQFIKKKHLR